MSGALSLHCLSGFKPFQPPGVSPTHLSSQVCKVLPPPPSSLNLSRIWAGARSRSRRLRMTGTVLCKYIELMRKHLCVPSLGCPRGSLMATRDHVVTRIAIARWATTELSLTFLVAHSSSEKAVYSRRRTSSPSSAPSTWRSSSLAITKSSTNSLLAI